MRPAAPGGVYFVIATINTLPGKKEMKFVSKAVLIK